MALLYFVLLCCIFYETSGVIYMTTEAGEITSLQSYGYDMPSGTTSFSFSVNTCSNTSVTFLDVNGTELFHVTIGVNDSFSSINIGNRTLSLSKDPGIGECSQGYYYEYQVLWNNSKINVTKIASDVTNTVVVYPPPTYTDKNSRVDINVDNIRDVAISTTGRGEWEMVNKEGVTMDMTTEADEMTSLQSNGYHMPRGTLSLQFFVKTCSTRSVVFLDVNGTELFHVIIGVNNSFSSINIGNRTLSLSENPGIGECSQGYFYEVLWNNNQIIVTEITLDVINTVVVYPPTTHTDNDSLININFNNIRDVAMSTTGKGEWNIHKEDSKFVFKTGNYQKSSNTIYLESIGFDVSDSFVFEVKACGDVKIRLDDISLIEMEFRSEAPDLVGYISIMVYSISTRSDNYAIHVYSQTNEIKSCNEFRLFKINWLKEQVYISEHEDCGMKVVLHIDNTIEHNFRPSVLKIDTAYPAEGLWKIHYTDDLKDCIDDVKETTTTSQNTTASMMTEATATVMTTSTDATAVTTKPTMTTMIDATTTTTSKPTTWTSKATTTTTKATTTTTKATTTTTKATTTTTKATTTTTKPTTTTTKPTTTTTKPTTTTTKPTTTTTKPTTTTTKDTTTTSKATTTTTKDTTTTSKATTTVMISNEQTNDTLETTSITSIKHVTTPTNEQCAKVCLCYQSNATYNSTELKEMIAELKEELTITKSTTSNYIRSKTSAPDDRPSAVRIGCIAVALLAAVILSVVALDLPNLLQAVALLRQNLLHKYTHTEQNVRFDPISME